MKLYLFLLAVVLSGCASDSGVVALGNDTFVISKQAATGLPGTGGIRTEALHEASNHCLSTDRAVEIVSESQSEPPYILGNYPRVEIMFQCVAAD